MTTETQRARRLFTVDEYDRMVVAGIFGSEDRLELIDGEILKINPIGPRHAACVANLTRSLITRIGERAVLWAQNPVTVATRSKPRPDVALLQPHSYFQKHPSVQDVLLFIEVADSSMVYDRGVKLTLYARAGIPEYWIVDVDTETVETFRVPAGDGFGDPRRIRRDDVIAPTSFPDAAFRVAELFA